MATQAKLPSIKPGTRTVIAGRTGSGKTIFLYSVVLSLTAAHSERTLELVIIDPKQTDFAKFWELIGAEGDLTKALTEWDRVYNSTSAHQNSMPGNASQASSVLRLRARFSHYLRKFGLTPSYKLKTDSLADPKLTNDSLSS